MATFLSLAASGFRVRLNLRVRVRDTGYRMAYGNTRKRVRAHDCARCGAHVVSDTCVRVSEQLYRHLQL